MGTLGNLNIGDFVYDPQTYNIYISMKEGGSEGNKIPSSCIRWRVIGKNIDGANTVTLLGGGNGYNDFNIGMLYDAAEPTNPNTNRQTNGNNRYKVSNILQWLNSTNKNWYTAQHTYDAVRTQDNNTYGLMYTFSPSLRSALQDFTKSSVADDGTLESTTKKVHLISEKEMMGDKADCAVDGSQYPYFQEYIAEVEASGGRKNLNINGSSRTPFYENNANSDCAVYYRRYYNSISAPSYTKGNVGQNFSTLALIVLPSDTVVSENYYDTTSDNKPVYAMINMPLAMIIGGTGSFKAPELSRNVTYKIYDDLYDITSFKICKDTVDNVVYSTTTITKGQEYSYTVDGSSYAINENHTYYFIAINSNGDELTKEYTFYRVNADPTILIYDESRDEWVYSLYEQGDISVPSTLRLKIADPDNLGQPMYLYLCEYNGTTYDLYDTIGSYTSDTELEYTVPDAVWKALNNGSHSLKIFNLDSSTFPQSPSSSFSVTWHCVKTTPAPYVTVESTEIGRQNVAFTVDYTPDTDTLQALTLVTVALDGNTISSINNPIAGSTLTLNITKAMLYNLSIGNHTLAFTVTDDLSQTGTSTVTFTRYNETPNVIMSSDLGRKNVGFDVSFGVSDDEGDVSSVKMYLDSTATSPIKEWTDVATGSTLTHTISKETLYGLSLGNHKIYVVAEDEFGYATVDADFTRYNDAPVVTATQDSTVHYDDFDVTYTVTDSEDDTVNLTFKIGEATIATVTDVEKDTTLTQSINISGETHGNKTLSIVATDSQGQTSTTTLDFVISTFPVITAEEIGGKTEAFTSTFTVDDADGDDLSVIATLGLVELVNLSNAPHNTPITLDITSAIFNGLEYGNNTITINVTDSNGATTTENVTFQKCSVPSMTITSEIPHEITTQFNVTVDYSNADGSNVTIKAYIDGKEVIQEQETP